MTIDVTQQPQSYSQDWEMLVTYSGRQLVWNSVCMQRVADESKRFARLAQDLTNAVTEFESFATTHQAELSFDGISPDDSNKENTPHSADPIANNTP